MGTTESTTLSLKRGWRQNLSHIIALGSPKVISRGEVPKVRNVDGRLHIACKVRHSHEWDPPVQVYGRYWPGDEFVDD